jgi:hypothetical protein
MDGFAAYSCGDGDGGGGGGREEERFSFLFLVHLFHYRELRGRLTPRRGKSRLEDHQALLAWIDSIFLALGEFGAFPSSWTP